MVFSTHKSIQIFFAYHYLAHMLLKLTHQKDHYCKLGKSGSRTETYGTPALRGNHLDV